MHYIIGNSPYHVIFSTVFSINLSKFQIQMKMQKPHCSLQMCHTSIDNHLCKRNFSHFQTWCSLKQNRQLSSRLIMEIELNRSQEHSLESAMRSNKKTEVYLNLVNHILIVFTTCYITWYSFTVGFEQYQTYHAWITTIGFQFFMSEGILVMYKYNLLTLNFKSRSLKIRLHWILQVIGASCAIFGIPYQIYYREITNRKHFHNTHAISGKIELSFTI